MSGNIYCMMFAGRPLSTPVRDALLCTAREMVKNGRDRQWFRLDDGEGLILLAGHGNVGGISGVLFSAEVETNEGKTAASYIVRRSDLDDDEEGVWDPWVNIAEEQRRRERAHLN